MSKGGRRSRKGSEDIPALLAGGGEDSPQGSERLGAGVGAEAPGDFLPDFHHAQVPFRLIVGEGHGGIVEEPQRILFVIAETE